MLGHGGRQAKCCGEAGHRGETQQATQRGGTGATAWVPASGQYDEDGTNMQLKKWFSKLLRSEGHSPSEQRNVLNLRSLSHPFSAYSLLVSTLLNTFAKHCKLPIIVSATVVYC